MSTRKPKAVLTTGSQFPLSEGSSRRRFHDLSVARTLAVHQSNSSLLASRVCAYFLFREWWSGLAERIFGVSGPTDRCSPNENTAIYEMAWMSKVASVGKMKLKKSVEKRVYTSHLYHAWPTLHRPRRTRAQLFLSRRPAISDS